MVESRRPRALPGGIMALAARLKQVSAEPVDLRLR